MTTPLHVMAILDEHKQTMPDEAYLALSTSLMQLHHAKPMPVPQPVDGRACLNDVYAVGMATAASLLDDEAMSIEIHYVDDNGWAGSVCVRLRRRNDAMNDDLFVTIDYVSSSQPCRVGPSLPLPSTTYGYEARFGYTVANFHAFFLNHLVEPDDLWSLRDDTANIDQVAMGVLLFRYPYIARLNYRVSEIQLRRVSDYEPEEPIEGEHYLLFSGRF